jgi:hypothetical protein
MIFQVREGRRMFGQLFGELMELTTNSIGEVAEVAVEATTEVANTVHDMGSTFIGQLFE